MLNHDRNSKIWYPAIYARLSDEDRDNKMNGVSLSIDNQIDILKGYVKDKGWQEPKIFYDDDRTGTNFNRPGWQNLYAAAQKGEINVIIIKDTSRFGRNWVKSGYYFEKIDEMNIRFISIQEGLDTIDPKCPAIKMLPFYFVFNEWHSQSTSEKIRTVFQNQAQQGKHRSYHAPYGYSKDSEDKYKLVVDPITAPIVKRIFEMRLQKKSFGSIARILNDEGILSPKEYSTKKYGIEHKQDRANKWSANSIVSITSNPVYCGDVVQNRVGGISYKNQKQVRKPAEEWIAVKDMHEPLVSRDDFQKCADMRESVGRIRSTKLEGISPFTGLLLCQDCGYKMTRTGTYYDVKSTGEKKLLVAYNCGAYANMGKTACSSHYILENDLKELLLSDIHEKSKKVMKDEDAVKEQYYSIKSQTGSEKLNGDRIALEKVNMRLSELDKLLRAAFEKSVLGNESPDFFTEYMRKCDTEKKELVKQAKQLTLSIEQQSRIENDIETFIALLKKYANTSEIDRGAVVELIDHITISASTVKPRKIEFHYNNIGNLEL